MHLRPPLPEAQEHRVQKLHRRRNAPDVPLHPRLVSVGAGSVDRTRARMRGGRPVRAAVHQQLQDEVLHQGKKGDLKLVCSSK